ncbi:MAG: fibronectin type III domain-containing protein [Paludibacteraceae bacterium]|nr:fibronectin type III domain-containing protein [Paludibacteraceae bacterium]
MKLHNALKTGIIFLCLMLITNILNAEITVTKLWESNTNIPANADGRQGAGYNGTVYVQDKSVSKIYAFTQSGRTEFASSTGGGVGISVDDNGNLAVLTTTINNPPTSINIYRNGSSTATSISFSFTNTGRCDYISASGDFYSTTGGYVYFYCTGQTTVNYVKIVSGAYSAVGTIGSGLTTGTSTSYVIQGNTSSLVCQVRGSAWQNISGNGISPDGVKLSTLGGCIFSIKNTDNTTKEIWAYNSGGTDYNSEFKVRNATDATDISTGLYIIDQTSPGISACGNWLTASKIDDYSYYIHQYCPGKGVGVWKVAASITAPTVSASTTSNIAQTSATLNASFTQGTKTITAHGFRYGTSSGNYPSSCSGTVSGTNFSAGITGLTANTTYYYQAYVTTADGTVYSNEKNFTTSPIPPTVTTNDATNIQTTTATLNASFTQGSKPITARGFNYGTTSGSYTLSADGAVSGSTFSANITGLTANTTYYYQAYVTTDDGTVYGNEKSFKTNLGAIVIAANESKPIANNYVGDIVIHHGGQISNDTAFSFTGQIRYKRTFNTPIVWHTCCFPFAIDHVTVEEDGVEYTIVPYYQGAPAHSCHFWIKTLDRDPSNPELYQRWTTPTTSTIKKDTAYIIIFPKITDSTSYYDNKVVTFYSTNGNHTINNTDMPVSTYEYTGNGFYFYANLSLRNQSFSGTEFYRLDRTPYTGNFELHENPIIVPSECFIQASDEFKQKSTSIFLPKSTEDSGVYTGLPPTLDTKTTPLLVINSINGIELLSHTAQTIAVYTTNGLKVATCTLSAGEIHTISLPKGIYIIVSDQSPLPLKVII